jgi:O-antigen ligase
MLQDTLKSMLLAFGVLGSALCLLWQQARHPEKLHWHGLMYIPLILLAYALGSMGWSHAYLAGVEAVRWFILALLLWVGMNALRQSSHTRLLLWGLHGGAVAASIWAALQFWWDFDLFPQVADPASSFANRNFFAEYAVCVVPFSAYLLATLRRPGWLVTMALSLAFNLVALMMTGTRSALIALLLVVAVMAVVLVRYGRQLALAEWGRRQQALVGLALVMGVAGLGSIPTGNQRVIQEKTGVTALERSALRAWSVTRKTSFEGGSSFSMRTIMWRASLRMLVAHPLSGVGAGAWEEQLPLYQDKALTREIDFYAHNDLLQLLSEYGLLVGGAALALLLGQLLLAAGQTWQLAGQNRQEAPLRAVTLASLLALLVVGNAGFPLHMASTCALLAAGLALLAASDIRLGRWGHGQASTLGWPPRWNRIMLGLVLAVTLVAVYIAQRAVMAERRIIHAIHIGNTLRYKHVAPLADRQAEMAKTIRQGIALNPHYRKLVNIAADDLAMSGDFATALWIFESLVASRPHIPDAWANMVLITLRMKESAKAEAALAQLKRLEPDSPRTRALEVQVLAQTDREAEAAHLLHGYLLQGRHEYDLLQAGYSLGTKLGDLQLATESLQLLIGGWPAEAMTAYLHLGQLYANAPLADPAQALASFKAGLKLAQTGQEQTTFLKDVPPQYHSALLGTGFAP